MFKKRGFVMLAHNLFPHLVTSAERGLRTSW